MKIIVTKIPADFVTNSLLSSFCPFLQAKTRIRFSASWWSGSKKYFCFLFIASRALLQSHTEFNRLLQGNFLKCYSCSYYSSMIITHVKSKGSKKQPFNKKGRNLLVPSLQSCQLGQDDRKNRIFSER